MSWSNSIVNRLNTGVREKIALILIYVITLQNPERKKYLADLALKLNAEELHSLLLALAEEDAKQDKEAIRKLAEIKKLIKQGYTENFKEKIQEILDSSPAEPPTPQEPEK